jgi:hypothetical protein
MIDAPRTSDPVVGLIDLFAIRFMGWVGWLRTEGRG